MNETMNETTDETMQQTTDEDRSEPKTNTDRTAEPQRFHGPTRAETDASQVSKEGNLGRIRPIQDLVERLGPEAVYGEPVRVGETVVVPVAELKTGFGFGSGSGHTRSEEGDGGGGGAAVQATPRGYIEITGTSVRYRPIRNWMPAILAGISAAGWLLYRISDRLLADEK